MATGKILAFGLITDIIGTSEMELHNMNSTDDVLNMLKHNYPKLNDVKFLLSLNKKIITENNLLENNFELALLPPFSGG